MNYRILILFALGFTIGCGSQGPTVDVWTAAAQGSTAELQKHIDAGTKINEKEPAGGSTPLIMTAVFGHTESARLLISNGAELEIKNNDGTNALIAAVFFCHPDMVQLLLESGADVNVTNPQGNTPLDIVAVQWSPELEGLYKMIAGAYQIQIDMDRIQKERSSVADVLKQHGGKTSGDL